MRLAVLVPDPGYPERWDWAFDIEASALRAAGCTVDPVVWTQAGDLSGYDLVLPLVAWGYHLQYERWLAVLDRAEAERWPMVNPPALLRWNSDKAYSRNSQTAACRLFRRLPSRLAATPTWRKRAAASAAIGS